MVLHFPNSFSPPMRKDINLLFLSLSQSLISNVLTYPLILSNTETNVVVTLSIYSIKYLELVFVSTNFKITILSTLIS